MKLYPIIFAEAAKSPTVAMSKGLVAVWIRSDDETPAANHTGGKMVLVSSNRFLATATDMFKRMRNNYGGGTVSTSNFTRSYGDKFQRSIVGQVSYTRLTQTKVPLFKVDTSAGVNKYGPLTYQLVMYAINQDDGWLRSDSSLTHTDKGTGSSSDVWNTMYKLSPAVYQRLWLGDAYPRAAAGRKLANCAAVNDYIIGQLGEYADLMRRDKPDTSEAFFREWCAGKGLEAGQFGHFWAYKMINTPAEISSLIDASSDLYNSVEGLRKQMGIRWSGEESRDRERAARAQASSNEYALVQDDHEAPRRYDDDGEEMDPIRSRDKEEENKDGMTPGEFDEIISDLGSDFFGRRYRSMH